MKESIRLFFLLFHLEFKIFFRQKSFFFSLALLLFIFFFIFNLTQEAQLFKKDSFLYSILWISLLLTSLLRLNRSFEIESRGVQYPLALVEKLPLPLFLAKSCFNFFLFLSLLIIGYGFLILFFNLSHAWLFISYTFFPLLGGILGVAILGTFLSAMSVFHHQKDLILPLLFYPLLIPLIVAVGGAIEFSSEGNFLEWKKNWLFLLYHFNLIFLLVTSFLFEFLWKTD